MGGEFYVFFSMPGTTYILWVLVYVSLVIFMGTGLGHFLRGRRKKRVILNHFFCLLDGEEGVCAENRKNFWFLDFWCPVSGYVSFFKDFRRVF